MPPRFPFHPFLLVWIFVVGWYRDSGGLAVWWEPLAYGMVGLVLAAAAAWFLQRRLRDPTRAAIILSLLVGGFCFSHELYSAMYYTLKGLGVKNDGLLAALLPAGVLYVGVMFGAAVRTRRSLVRLSRYLDITLALILASLLLQVAHAGRVARRQPGEANITLQPSLVTMGLSDQPHPDIYFLVLDSHTSPASLRRYWHYDPAEWLDQLRQRGFQVLEDAHSNFAFTPYSILASLSMNYPPPSIDLDRRQWNQRVSQAIERAAVARFLRRQGYALHNFSPFKISAKPPFYTVGCFQEATGTAAFGSLVRKSVLGFPWFSFLWPAHGESGEIQEDRIAASEEILDRLSRLPARGPADPPRFVYAHVILPHFPYVFDRSGQRRAPRPENDAAAYLDQLIYTDQRVLAVIDALLARSTVPPLIVLQGDHGFRYLPEPQQAAEATCILNAVRFPEGSTNALPAGLTPVNTFRYLLRHGFGADLDLIEDRVKRPGPRGV